MIILAEDEAPLRTLLVDALHERSIAVLAAADGKEALGLIGNNSGVQLLLSDIKMPNMDGYELTERALDLHPELKVLLMTGYAAEQPPSELFRAREIRTMKKPFDVDRMCDLVTEMLSRP